MILAATGLKREARIVSGPGVTAIAGGGDSARLEAELTAGAAAAQGIISIGLGGALAPGLKPGDCVIAERVTDGTLETATDIRWRAALAARLPFARAGVICGTGNIVATPAAKAALYRATGALAADMESHVAARVAARHRLPFMALRIISDASDHHLPPAALIGMRLDGGMNIGGVLRSLAVQPFQLPALLGTAFAAEAGFRALLCCHRLAGPGVGCPDLVDHALDMA